MKPEIALNDLKRALCNLSSTGQNGFEGLLAAVLEKITGHPFRIASAGLQDGRDGESNDQKSHVSFEAKLYTGPIPKERVQSKATALIGSTSIPDVWILGATVGLDTQLSQTLKSAFERVGVSYIVLDWPDTSNIPPLACACAMAAHECVGFIANNTKGADVTQKTLAALELIRQHEDFGRAARSLKELLEDPTLGLPMAIEKNQDWLKRAFSDKSRAKQVFKQTLSPFADARLPLLDRPQLLARLENAAFSTASDKTVAITGPEGCGKSWLFAQGWMSIPDRPVTLVIPASDLPPKQPIVELESFLVDRLIEQTSDSAQEYKKERWRRRFERWKVDRKSRALRLILLIDGINQNPKINWVRWLDSASAVLNDIGGQLVVTAREGYFRDYIETHLHTEIETVQVPEWTNAQLNQLLKRLDVNGDSITPRVHNSLKNPRLLSIAAELLNTEQIKNFSELSVESLLFEHIRVAARIGSGAEHPKDFVARLTRHASEIINRISAQEREGSLIFEVDLNGSNSGFSLSSDLLAASEGRFFQALPDISGSYTLSEDGLNVALGLAIINAVQATERNQKNIAESLDQLIEPIGALDKAANAVFAALMIACVDKGCTDEIKMALFKSFVHLQNIDGTVYPAFALAVSKATDAAMQALFSLAVSDNRAENYEWLRSALRDARDTPQCLKVINGRVDKWLRYYSLVPELSLLSAHNKSEEEIAECKKSKELELASTLASLPKKEQTFLEKKMIRDDLIDPSSLFDEAIRLLAGMPLSSFSEAFVAMAYSQSLNANPWASFENFESLIRFNNVDWANARTKLLAASAIIKEETASKNAKWAYVAVLRATGAAEDGNQANELLSGLLKERERPTSWRLVEQYCPNDPCDPFSSRPDKIDETAVRYSQIDVSAVQSSRSRGSEDLFLQHALPGIARFSAGTAKEVHRRLAIDILNRPPDATSCIAVAHLEPHTAILDDETIKGFLDRANELHVRKQDYSNDTRYQWVDSQYSLLVALPHLTGDEQLKQLAEMSDGKILIKTLPLLKAADPKQLDRLLTKAVSDNDADKQATILTFARHSETLFLPDGKQHLKKLAQSRSSEVRAKAFGVIALIEDRDLLSYLAESNWRASVLDPKKDHYEVWYGSQILIKAGLAGALEADDVVDRISPKFFSAAVENLGVGANAAVAKRLDTSIKRVLDIDIRPPHITAKQALSKWSTSLPSHKWIDEPEQALLPEEFASRIFENSEEIDARQERARKAFDRFEQSLTRDEARIVIEDVGVNAVKAMLVSDPANFTHLANLFLELPAHKLAQVKNIGLSFGYVLSDKNPALAKRIFERLEKASAFVNLINGTAEIPLEALYIWQGADNEHMDSLRIRRLNDASTDHQLGLEVLAALKSGKSSFLQAHASDLVGSQRPVEAARGLMIYGFGETTPQAGQIIKRFSDAEGFIGKAAKAAEFASNRDQWSQHLFRQMCEAQSAEDFWRFSILFLKIVDGRHETWEESIDSRSELSQRFGPTLEDELGKRVKHWKAKREKTLFGSRVPDRIFVETMS